MTPEMLQAEVEQVEAEPFVHDWWGAEGRILAAEPCEARPHSDKQTDGALRILSGCGYDPGNAAYRHHTAINEHTKHADTFIRFGHSNPFCDLRQIDGNASQANGDCGKARALMDEADVIHSHVDWWMQYKAGYKWRARPDQLVIRHYHGTRWDKKANAEYPANQQWPRIAMMEDDCAGVTLVGARLTLCALRPSRMEWLPIPVPCDRYRAMVPTTRKPGPFRIAHSPSRRDYKGTADLVVAVEALRRKGLQLDLVMIEGKQHGEALRMKADCDLTFDSFWLGIQGSGLEAAAMGQMVVAGDDNAADLYENSEVGYVPYTFAATRRHLADVIERAITDPDYYDVESMCVGRYVRQFHDYSAVAKRYERIIAKATGWQNVSTTTKRGKHVAA